MAPVKCASQPWWAAQNALATPLALSATPPRASPSSGRHVYVPSAPTWILSTLAQSATLPVRRVSIRPRTA